MIITKNWGCLEPFIFLGIVILLFSVFSPPDHGGTTPAGVPRSNYQPSSGNCFVPPQGDPVYDEFYAKNVNDPNCKAFVDQSNAHNTDSETRKTDWETLKDQLITIAFFGILGLVGAFLVYSMFSQKR